MQLFLKILNGMADSADPDQTAPERAVRSGSTLFAYSIFSETLVYEIFEHLNFTVRKNKHLGLTKDGLNSVEWS